jgi:hypothetical protein
MKKFITIAEIISNLKIMIPVKASKKNGPKFSNDDMPIPTTSNYNILFDNSYNVQQLKIIAKHHELKHSGNKNELTLRIYSFLLLSNNAIKIQKLIRRHLVMKYKRLHGPAVYDRKLCTNESDFLSGDKLDDIPYTQFFSFVDNDDFIYGFDIISLYNLIAKSDRDKGVKNPYNRNLISEKVIQNVKSMIKISRVLNIPIDIDIKQLAVSNEKSLDLRILDLFQYINSLGNYSEPIWYSDLTRPLLIRFFRELIDIWNYRAQITIETKRSICPPTGDPFSNVNFYHMNHDMDINILKKYILGFLEKLVYSGIDNDSKALGAYYVLAAITLVNMNAANTLPWLYQSVVHTTTPI